MNSAPPETTPVRRVRVRPLLTLVPYVMRYRGQVAAALVALLVAAMATLIVPLAVRRMIDFGFSAERIGLIDQYFAVMIAVAGVLACASAARYYLVTIIGERVVADLRAAVFAHLTSLAPAFFDTVKTGEITSRLTADTTQIKSAVGSSVSVALRNLVLFFGSSVMMAVTSPRLSFFVILAIPVIVLPLVAFGRLVRRRSRTAQDTLADASAYAAELIGAIRAAGLHQRGAAQSRFGSAVERVHGGARPTRARLPRSSFFSCSQLVMILGSARRTSSPDAPRPDTRPVHPYAVFAASGPAAERSLGRAVASPGAAERLMELMAVEPAIKAPPHPRRPRSAAREVAFEAVRFAYPASATFVLDGVSFAVRQGEGRNRRAVGAAKARSSTSCCASTTSRPAA
jgi:ATP-binding cassette subfamily B protein